MIFSATGAFVRDAIPGTTTVVARRPRALARTARQPADHFLEQVVAGRVAERSLMVLKRSGR